MPQFPGTTDPTSKEALYDASSRATSSWERLKGKRESPFIKEDLATRRAAYFRWRVLDNLEKYLLEFESQFQKKGGKIIWAPEAKDVMSELTVLLDRKMSGAPVYMQHAILEETGVETHLKVRFPDLVHTSVAGKILHDDHHKSDHPVFPLLLKSRDYVSKVMSRQKEMGPRSGPDQWLEHHRYQFHDQIKNADTLISGVRFLMAETGSIVLTDEEGRQMEAFHHIHRHIYIAGIDQLVGTLQELDVLLPLYARSSSGQPMPGNVYISSPDRHLIQPKEMILILVDNGRTQLISEPKLRPAAYCIQCGACHMVCPVFKLQGNQSYGGGITGPIGIVSEPQKSGFKDTRELPFQSTLCGKCNEVCPIRIDLHQLILENRNMMLEKGFGGSQEKLTWIAWKRIMLKRKRMNQNQSIKSFMFKTAFKKSWGNDREFPNIQTESFNEWYIKKFGGTEE